jgi:hypothetical protein
MILNDIAPKIQKSAGFEELSYKLETKNQGNLFHILRSQLYSNKLAAIIREYSTNAVDIHTETDQTRPVEVRLPTPLNPTLQIQDFGCGMTMEDIQDRFLSMASSTKRDSNLLNGCLGIGCKAGFCYTNSFNIISVTENEYIEGTSYIDETKEGKFAILEHRKPNPNEVTGVRIQIPIHQTDFKSIKETAIQILGAFTNPILLLEGTTPIKIPQTAIPPNEVQFKTNPYGVKETKGYVYMGNVCYPLSEENLKSIDIPLTQGTYLFGVPIGMVDFVASREALEFTERTKLNLRNIYFNFSKKANASLQTLFSKSENIWEAFWVANKIAKSKNSKYKSQIQMLWDLNQLEYKGEKIARYGIDYSNFILWKKSSPTDTPLTKESPGWTRINGPSSARFLSRKSKFWVIFATGSERLRFNLQDNKKHICNPWAQETLQEATDAGIPLLIIPKYSNQNKLPQAPLPKEWQKELIIRTHFSDKIKKTTNIRARVKTSGIDRLGKIFVYKKRGEKEIELYGTHLLTNFQKSVIKTSDFRELVFVKNLPKLEIYKHIRTPYAQKALEPFLNPQTPNYLKAFHLFIKATETKLEYLEELFAQEKTTPENLRAALAHSQPKEIPVTYTLGPAQKINEIAIEITQMHGSPTEFQSILTTQNIQPAPPLPIDQASDYYKLLISKLEIEGYTFEEFKNPNAPTKKEREEFETKYPLFTHLNLTNLPLKLALDYFQTAKPFTL